MTIFTHHVSRITFHASRFTHHVSRITFHASRFTHHVSRITFHASRFTHHVSRITFHASRITWPTPQTAPSALPRLPPARPRSARSLPSTIHGNAVLAGRQRLS